MTDMPALALSSQKGTTDARSITKARPSYQVMEELLNMLPRQYKGMAHQLKLMQDAVTQGTTYDKQTVMTLERVHDRLDSLLVEQRTTNVLLSQLVALHSSVVNIDEFDLHTKAEKIRQQTYGRVYNGE